MNQSRKALNYLGAQARRFVSSAKGRCTLAAGALALSTVEAYATVPTEISTLKDDAEDTFDLVKGVKISIVGFFILLGMIKWLRGR